MAPIRSIDEKSDLDHPEAVALETKSQGSSDSPTWTVAEETAVRRKLDWQLVPAVTILYLLCFLDRYGYLGTLAYHCVVLIK